MCILCYIYQHIYSLYPTTFRCPNAPDVTRTFVSIHARSYACPYTHAHAQVACIQAYSHMHKRSINMLPFLALSALTPVRRQPRPTAESQPSPPPSPSPPSRLRSRVAATAPGAVARSKQCWLLSRRWTILFPPKYRLSSSALACSFVRKDKKRNELLRNA